MNKKTEKWILFMQIKFKTNLLKKSKYKFLHRVESTALNKEKDVIYKLYKVTLFVSLIQEFFRFAWFD